MSIIGLCITKYVSICEFGDISIEPPEQKKQPKYLDIKLIDENILKEGTIYPGEYEGESFSFESVGKLFKKEVNERAYIEEEITKLWDIFRKYKPSGGKLIINELGHILIKFIKNNNLKTIYIGTIYDYIHDFEKYMTK